MGWTDRCKQLPLGIRSLLPGKGGLCWEQTKSPFQTGFLFLIPTNTAGPLLIEMVATATVGHVLLACVGALRVDACLPHRAWGTDTQTLIDIYRGKDGDNGVKPGGLPETQPLDLQRNPISLLFIKPRTQLRQCPRPGPHSSLPAGSQVSAAYHTVTTPPRSILLPLNPQHFHLPLHRIRSCPPVSPTR